MNDVTQTHTRGKVTKNHKHKRPSNYSWSPLMRIRSSSLSFLTEQNIFHRKSEIVENYHFSFLFVLKVVSLERSCFNWFEIAKCSLIWRRSYQSGQFTGAFVCIRVQEKDVAKTTAPISTTLTSASSSPGATRLSTHRKLYHRCYHNYYNLITNFSLSFCLSCFSTILSFNMTPNKETNSRWLSRQNTLHRRSSLIQQSTLGQTQKGA
jgi:hypothetical protein